jgi:serine O-acetyltransferase
MNDKRHLFQSDLNHYYHDCCGSDSPTVADKIKLWLLHPGLHCVAIYRFGQFVEDFAPAHPRSGLLLQELAWLLKVTMRCFYHVSLEGPIGPGFYLSEISNVHIKARAMGEKVKVAHNVTIGSGGLEERPGGFPCIGSHVTIGPGAIISGAIEIGDGVTIAPGAVVRQDVPAQAMVEGNPARVHPAIKEVKPS